MPSDDINIKPCNIISEHFEVELAYADATHRDNIFIYDNISLYDPKASLLAHHKILDILHQAIKFVPDGKKLRVYDCFRPMVAQKFMADYVIANNIDPSLVSKPGEGGHPRGMAIDCALVAKSDQYGEMTVDYGCGFDDFTMINAETGYVVAYGEQNAIPLAARQTRFIPFMAKQNRLELEALMQKAALACGTLLMPLHQEWWDFRFPKDQTDLKYILSSFNRILFDDFGHVPDIDDMNDFIHYWEENYHQDKIPIEKRHIFEDFPHPSEVEIIYYQDYAPLDEEDICKIGYKVLNDQLILK